jgi:hypothetical protein
VEAGGTFTFVIFDHAGEFKSLGGYSVTLGSSSDGEYLVEQQEYWEDDLVYVYRQGFTVPGGPSPSGAAGMDVFILAVVVGLGTLLVHAML